LLACFGEELGRSCGHCDNCSTPVSQFDGTIAAQKVLSAIYRTGQMFGAVHIINVLRGETSPMVEKHGHDRLPTFGVGSDRPAPFWRSVIRQLIASGALATDSGEYASLKLVAEKARAILRGESQVLLREDKERPKLPRIRETATVSGGTDGPMFDALRTWRMAEAKRQSVPPYVIFHDSVLREIAAARPRSLDALGTLRGVGASKLERYGAAVLAIVASA
jgi:ATP-dependent DNA helicase RecQ